MIKRNDLKNTITCIEKETQEKEYIVFPLSSFTISMISSKDLFSLIAPKLGLHAVSGVVCENIGLTRRSAADLALCTTRAVNQRPEHIKLAPRRIVLIGR